jgi:hypothetical protein
MGQMFNSYSIYRHLFQAFAAIAASFLVSCKSHRSVQCRMLQNPYLTGNV